MPRKGTTAAALGLLLLSLYVLTMSGHTVPADEETTYAVAESIVERGTLAVPTDRELVAVPGVDGRNYSLYGLVPSLEAVPLYALGDLADEGVEPRYREMARRFVVGMRDPILTALTAVLVFLCGERLGYRRRVAILLALAFGGATIAWPYAGHQWTEPSTGFWLLLATYAAIVGRDPRKSAPEGHPDFLGSGRQDHRLPWMGAAGLALGCAVASKVSTLVVVPVFVLYLGADLRRLWRPDRRAGSLLFPFGAGLLVAVVVLVALPNQLRFGAPWETGYTRTSMLGDAIDTLSPWGIIGLLASPGKSLFLYSPIAVLGVIGLVPLARRAPHEAALLAGIVALHVVSIGALVPPDGVPAVAWHGDSAWGPRYLVPVTAMLVLPAGALLCWRAGRIAFGALAVVGVAVQLLGVLVPYAYYNETHGGTFGEVADRRRWEPALVPVVGHARLLTERVVGAWQHQPPAVRIGEGFLGPWTPAGSWPKWTDGRGVLVVPPDVGGPSNTERVLNVTVAYVDFRTPESGPSDATIAAEGLTMLGTVEHRPNLMSARFVLPPRRRTAARIVLPSATFVPAEHGVAPDSRRLGIMVAGVHVAVNETPVVVGEDLMPELPVTDERPWGPEARLWFWRHDGIVLDIWPWFLWYSGLSRWLLVLVLVPLAGLVAGAVLVRGALRVADPWRRLLAAA